MDTVFNGQPSSLFCTAFCRSNIGTNPSDADDNGTNPSDADDNEDGVDDDLDDNQPDVDHDDEIVSAASILCE